MAISCPNPACPGDMAEVVIPDEGDESIYHCSVCRLAIKKTELDSGKAYTYYG